MDFVSILCVTLAISVAYQQQNISSLESKISLLKAKNSTLRSSVRENKKIRNMLEGQLDTFMENNMMLNQLRIDLKQECYELEEELEKSLDDNKPIVWNDINHIWYRVISRFK